MVKEVRLLRIGTRGSPLALIQAAQVRDMLRAAQPDLSIEIEVIKTTGDSVQDRTLAEIGGKGLFTKEIEDCLLDGRIDLAVHSVKDMQTILPDGLVLGAVLPREDVRDALISRTGGGLDDLPSGAVVGTASLRRQAQILARRPDLRVMPFRGNVQTRLRKLEEGVADATLLAMAGLRRLGRSDVASEVLDADEFVPAVGQGAIGVEVRADEESISGCLASISDQRASIEIIAERALLAELDGSCRTPIAALARADDRGGVTLHALIAKPDGTALHAVRRKGAAARAAEMGIDAGRELKALAGPGFLQ